MPESDLIIKAIKAANIFKSNNIAREYGAFLAETASAGISNSLKDIPSLIPADGEKLAEGMAPRASAMAARAFIVAQGAAATQNISSHIVEKSSSAVPSSSKNQNTNRLR